MLEPGGRLTASVDHPFVAYTIQEPPPDYFATTSYAFDWMFGGQTVPMKFWRKPLHVMTDAFTAVRLPRFRHQRAAARSGSA